MQVTPAVLTITSKESIVRLTLTVPDKKERELVKRGAIVVKVFIYDKQAGKFVPVWGTVKTFSVDILEIAEKTKSRFEITLKIKSGISKDIYGLALGIKDKSKQLSTNSFIIIPVFPEERLKLTSQTKVVLGDIKCRPRVWLLLPPREVRCTIEIRNIGNNVVDLYLLGRLNKTPIDLRESRMLLPVQRKKERIILRRIDNASVFNRLEFSAKIYSPKGGAEYLAINRNLIMFYIPWYIVVIGLTLFGVLYKFMQYSHGKDKGRRTEQERRKRRKASRKEKS